MLVDQVQHITKTPDWLKKVDEAFLRVEKSSWKFTKFSLDNVITLATDSSDPSFARALTHVVVDLLQVNGLIDFRVPIISYRYKPSLTIDEAIDLMLNDQLPKITIPAIKGVTILGTVKAMVKMYIVQLEAMMGLRQSLAVKLYQMVDHLYHIVKHGGTLTQDQKTFVLHMMMPEYNRSRHVGEPHIPHPQECNIPSVFEWYNKLQAQVQQGPCTRFITMISNRSLEDMQLYVGPFVPTLPIVAGYLHPVGPFTNINLSQVDSFNWDHNAQLLGSAEAVQNMRVYVGKTLSGNGIITNQMIQSPAIKYTVDDLSSVGKRVPFVLDLPDIELVWRSSTIIARYASVWRERPVEMLPTDADPREVFMDKAINHETTGETTYGRLSIDEWTFADMAYFDSPLGKERKTSFDVKCKVWAPQSDKPSTALVEQEKDMRPFYANHGNYQIKPAFAEAMRPLRRMLEEPAPEGVNYLRMRLGLNEFTFKRIERGLTVAFNYFRLKSRYGRVPQIAKAGETSDQAVERIVRTLVSGG